MNKLILGLLALLLVLQVFVAVKVFSAPKAAPAPALGAATPSDQITNWVGGAFSGDLSVGGQFTLSESNTSTVSGSIVVPKTITVSMTTATTTACTVLNNSGVNRVVLGASVVDTGTAASTGAVAWQAGTSTASGANGSSAVVGTKVINTTITRASGIDVLVTTSTAQSAYSTWQSGSYFNFISGTTTNAGSCKVLFF